MLILEAEGNLVRLRPDLLLTDDEREAIEGDVSTFQKLRAKHWDTATPSGRAPREMEAREEPVFPASIEMAQSPQRVQ